MALDDSKSAAAIGTAMYNDTELLDSSKALYEKIKANPISSIDDVIALVPEVMKLAKSIKDSDGQGRKNAVVGAIRLLIKNLPVSDAVRTTLLVTSSVVVPPAIDAMFSIKPEDFKKVFSGCCGKSQ